VDSEWRTPAQTPDPDLPARVPRRYVGPAPSGKHRPEPEPDPAGKKAWDKLLLVVGAAVVVAALLIVPGILNRGGQNPVAEAAQATMDSPGVRMTFTGALQGGSAQMTMSGTGVMNGETHRAAMSLTMSGAIGGQSQNIQMDEVVDHLDVYMHAPSLTSGFGGGKSWVLLRMGTLAGLSQSGDGALSSGVSSEANPAQMLDGLKSASDNVREIGPEQVAGIATKHYSADIDMEKALSEAGGSDSIASAISSLHPSETVDVWIDGQNLLRRARVEINIGTVGSFTMTMDFSDYGIHPQVDVPPQSDVYDMTQMLQGLQHQLGN
jgi:hypothetical protein